MEHSQASNLNTFVAGDRSSPLTSSLFTIMDGWHPVLLSHQLKRKPVRIQLCNQDIVLFRTSQRHVGALKDVCPHRRMRLSLGWMDGDRLICPYHGWSIDPQGMAMSAGQPHRYCQAETFDAIERYNTIWIKRSDSQASVPEINDGQFSHACTLHRRIQAPLELVLDNFSELEHSTTTHTVIGYDKTGSSDVDFRVISLTDTGIKLHCSAPQRRFPALVEWILGIHNGDRYNSTWTIHFSPVHAIFDQHWTDPITGQIRPTKTRMAVFFNFINTQETDVRMFIFSPQSRFGISGFHLILKPILWGVACFELWRDQYMVENIADKNVALRGMHLGRFDRALVETRKRLRRVYQSCNQSCNP